MLSVCVCVCACVCVCVLACDLEICWQVCIIVCYSFAAVFVGVNVLSTAILISQAVAFMLADMAAGIEAARLLTYKAAFEIDNVSGAGDWRE